MERHDELVCQLAKHWKTPLDKYVRIFIRHELPDAGSIQKTTRSDAEKEHGDRSVLVQEDVDDLMLMVFLIEGHVPHASPISLKAKMAGREFTTERGKIVSLDIQRVRTQEQETATITKEQQNWIDNAVKIPRRPKWEPHHTAEDVDRQEKQYFVEWRRQLARLTEQIPQLLLTPYEKNLEVWRQLWRVIERSDILVQVVDARNPLLYYSDDLVRYATDINPDVISVVLLNKADLVDEEIRIQWSEYFIARKTIHAFWSAKGVLRCEARSFSSSASILDVAAVLELLKYLSSTQTKFTGDKKRAVVGLVGYPNVGKSSTINALFGQKKTPVAPTPGRTKHFQTLNVDDLLCLCDCPGLVLPTVAKSKPEMVAAGVIPVDGLTDVVAPVSVILSKVGLAQFIQVYGLSMDRAGGLDPRSQQFAVEVMAMLAASRGWMQAAGRPDQTKAGRGIIKDYLSGKLLCCESPPGLAPKRRHFGAGDSADSDQESVLFKLDSRMATNVKLSVERDDEEPVYRRADDKVLFNSVDFVSTKDTRKSRRAAHKFQRKPPRKKGNRGRQYDQADPPVSEVHAKGSMIWPFGRPLHH